MPAKTLMIQGTASHVGKSILTAAFCRILKRKGYSVAPFKAQNMSNNSFVTRDGGEIGRAQAVQAEACGLEPSVLMNPILLKPNTDKKAQIVALGKVAGKSAFIGDSGYRKKYFPVVHGALRQLMENHEVVIIEGAGSAAEVNLKKRDLVNMNIAKAVNAPVILVGNIDWGGIFAQLAGTFAILDREEKRLVKAFLINKFRGEEKLFRPGIRWIEKRTSRKVLGVIPYIHNPGLAEEDSISSHDSGTGNISGILSGKTKRAPMPSLHRNLLLIDVVWLPRISNFTDFDSFQKHSDVQLRYVREPDSMMPDLLIIPGTKSTIADLQYLYRSGLAGHVLRLHAAGVPILGICGGYQMLGRAIKDPHRVESETQEIRALGLLPAVTRYEKAKKTSQVTARHIKSGITVRGYEIHMGQTRVVGKAAPFFQILGRDSTGFGRNMGTDGIILKRKLPFGTSWIAGTFLHGLFDEPAFLRHFLTELSAAKKKKIGNFDVNDQEPQKGATDPYDRLADIVESNIDMKFVERLLEKHAFKAI